MSCVASSIHAQVITRIESVQSLYIQTFNNSTKLSTATGFVFKSKTRSYLITNWHVATNKHPVTKDWIDPKNPISPNRIEIVHNSKKLGEHISIYEPLFDRSGKALFKEFTLGKEMVDIVAIPLVDTLDITLYPVSYLKESDSILLQPTDRLFVLGFPKGKKSAPFFPIWKSGLIASEPDIDQENKPIIWLDSESFPGMSGSPVYFISDKITYKNGSVNQYLGGPKSFLIGVFSHQYQDVNVGAIWKAKFLNELFSYLE